MVPMLTCGLVRSNFAFATGVLLWTSWFAPRGAFEPRRTSVDLGLAAGSLRPRLTGLRRQTPLARKGRSDAARSDPGDIVSPPRVAAGRFALTLRLPSR